MEKRCPGCMQPAINAPFCPHCGYPAQKDNEAHQLHTGTVLQERYLVGKVLGQGGFGITYLGWDEQTQAPVAIKEYYPASQVTRDTVRSNHVHCYTDQLTSAYHISKERFLREAKALSRLEDVPAIVRVQECFELNNTVYIIMEFIRGTDLRHYLVRRGKPLTLKETLAILRPIMDALEAVHSRGLVHRDISPDNIMLHPTRGSILLDFGAVRDVGNADVNSPLTKSTEAILKHGFAPLEQYRSRGSLGPWTDLYALCATIYYCLAGKVPPEALARMMGEEALDWSQVPDLTDVQRLALEKGMAIHAKERFDSIAPLRKALYSEETPQPVPEPEMPRKPWPEEPPHADPVTHFIPKKRIAIIAGAAALVIAAGIGTAVLLGGEKRDEPRISHRETDDIVPTATQAQTLPIAEQPLQTEPMTEAATQPPETQAPTETPTEAATEASALPAAAPQEFIQESPDRLDTVYYSSSGITHDALECSWNEFPAHITFPDDAGFTESNTTVKILNSAGKTLAIENYPFLILWDGSSVEIRVPKGLPEGVYHIEFSRDTKKMSYVISIGTPGQSYCVEDSTKIWYCYIYHSESALYLRQNGQRLEMAGKDQRTSFDDNAALSQAIIGNGSDPVFNGVTAVTIQEMHLQGSGSSGYYVIRCGDQYLGYSASRGLYLTTQPDMNCRWDTHYS